MGSSDHREASLLDFFCWICWLMREGGLWKLLVGGDWNHGIWIDFPNIGNFIIPTDELIFFRGVETTIQTLYCVANMLGIMIYTYLFNNPRTGNPVLNQPGCFLVFNGMIEGFGIWCTPKAWQMWQIQKTKEDLIWLFQCVPHVNLW